MSHVEGRENLEEELAARGSDVADLLSSRLLENFAEDLMVDLDQVEKAHARHDGAAPQLVSLGQRCLTVVGQVSLKPRPGKSVV